MKCDPLSKDLFVFRNRAEDRMKILFWDRSGFCLYYKRLEKGRFSFPTVASAEGVEIDHAELLLILEGIELDGKERRSGLEDTDLTETIARIQSKLLSLEAAQAAFARINRQSLFDLIS